MIELTREGSRNKWRVFYDSPTESHDMQFLGTVEADFHEKARQVAIATFQVSEPEKLIVVH